MSYVGNADFHDGVVLHATESGDRVTVVVKGYSGREWVAEFYGVTSVRKKSEGGMLIYAVSEMRDSRPLRRFVFVNWDGGGEAYLEVIARDMRVG